MVTKHVKITSESGIHARPATNLVNVAMEFDCDISLVAFQKSVDFKSIMGVMSLGVYSGTTVEVICDGDDEQEALDAIVLKIISMGLGKEV